MKSLKKSVIAVLVIGVLSVAGMAFAGQHGNGQSGPMGPFGGPRHMGMRQWGGNDMPPAPQMPDGAPCAPGQRGQMFGQQPMWGQNFCGQAFGNRWDGPCGGRFGQRGMFAPNMPRGFCGQGFGRGRGRGPAFGQGMRGPNGGRFQRREDSPLGHHGMFSPNMPQDIRNKAIEAAKLHIDLEDVLSQKPLNREKAIELNGKINQLKQEIRDWRFEQKLDRIEEWSKKPGEDSKTGQDK